jgi:hypothetical protein
VVVIVRNTDINIAATRNDKVIQATTPSVREYLYAAYDCTAIGQNITIKVKEFEINDITLEPNPSPKSRELPKIVIIFGYSSGLLSSSSILGSV